MLPERLVERSPSIKAAIDAGRTAVVGMAYRLEEGRADLVSGVGHFQD